MPKTLPSGPTVIDDDSEVRFVAGTDQFAIRLKDGHLHVRAIDTNGSEAQLAVIPTSRSTVNLQVEHPTATGPVDVEGPTLR
ncbi:hypothetical protein [Myceligenerans pegani]|uniref:Uncharacterized protein n=1 Tax=Myceligenerans pegani TaxID=2776917 RepID=A0ABR9MX46_9MICO|nr:hypothetical protein [Myceligenerans sp. TRM 65318]MBE1875969.1 hypothetical protein [Myceligenerans sp. TRM 65318]MBE3018240.1 hypothetical protein [Myceligenerans sp. TRM 65318]